MLCLNTVLWVLVVEPASRLPCFAVIAVVGESVRVFQGARQVHEVPSHDRGVALNEVVVEPSATAI